VRFSNAAGAVTASLVTGSATGDGNDSFVNVEGLFGSNFGDSLSGGNAANGTTLVDGLSEIFRGEAGNDTIDGGQGYDRADYTTSTSAVSVTLNDALDGVAQDGLGGTDTLRNIEGVRGSIFNDTLTGSDSALFESFEGREGDDLIDGKGGADRADYRNATSGVVVNLAAGTASDGYGSSDTLIGIEQVRGSRDFNDNLSGSNGNDKLEGMGGDDTLVGGAGNDSYVYTPGADGNDLVVDASGTADVLVIRDASDAQESFPQFERVGNDLVISVFNAGDGQANGVITLQNHYTSGTIETLETYREDGTLHDSFALSTSLTGGALGDLISGTAVADSITGGSGADWLFGRAGNDTINGGPGTDTLSGGVGDDSLVGGADDDTYIWNPAEAGNDSIVDAGGAADELKVEVTGYAFTAERSGDNLTFTALLDGLATSTVTIVNHYTTGKIENLVLGPSGSELLYTFVDGLVGTAASDWVIGTIADDSVSGGASGDQLFGGVGLDTLDGGSGDDVLSGGTGGDTYLVDSSLDQIVEVSTNPAEIDTVQASASFVLSENLEVLVLTGTAAIDGTGNDLDNDLSGNQAANMLDGGAGADSMAGGTGSDTYFVDDLSDVIVELNNTPALGLPLATELGIYAGVSDTVNSLVDFTLGDFVENLVQAGIADLLGAGNTLRNEMIGNDGANLLLGMDDIDTLIGGLGDDQLDGGAGNDSMLGGLGDDLYFLDSALDIVSELAGQGNDTILTSFSYSLADTDGAGATGGNVENLQLAGAGAINATGNIYNNILFAGDGNNVLSGGAGLDTASYLFAGGSVSVGLVAGAQATGSSGSDSFVGIENLTGSHFNDTLNGNAGVNVLDGATGADVMTGGDGADTYFVDNASDNVNETNAGLAGGVDTVAHSLASYSLGSNVENGRILSIGAAGLTGNALANTLFAGDGDNLLDGGAGLDTASYQYASGAVNVALIAGAQDTGASGFDTFINIENLSGSIYNDNLTGNASANVLDGGAGADTMTGGDGADVYYARNAGDIVIESNAAVSGGNDTVLAYYGGYVLTANVEIGRIMVTGTGAIAGNAQNNTLQSGAGNNVLTGGLGQDTASYLYATGAVNVSLAIGGAQATGGSGSDTFVGIENLTGGAFDDTLLGNASANILDGGVSGADSMTGGDGADTYLVREALDQVTETNAGLAGGVDLVWSYLSSYTLGANVENGRILAAGVADITGNTLNNVLYAGVGNNILTADLGTDTLSYAYMAAGVTASLATGTATGGSGVDSFSGFENLTGSNFNDSLTGDAGANQLDGGLGVDTMTGGDGNDSYVLRNGGDTAIEASGDVAGTQDIALVYYGGYTLADNVENAKIMAYTAAGINGNALNNLLIAGINNNAINGGAGNDTVSYLFASAAVNASLATGTATGGSGIDSFTSIENLIGSNFSDILAGDGGINLLLGGLGADTLTGGAGADTFEYNAETDSGNASGFWDSITDFVSGVDKIDLSGIDANTAIAGNQGFQFLTSGAAFNSATTFLAPQRLFFDTTADVLYGNTDADAAAEFAIELAGLATLIAADIMF
jgi:Ca2+-binding RTX toxin-like protein